MKSKLTLITLLLPLCLWAQSGQLIIHPQIRLPKDSTISKQLTNSLEKFLAAANKPNKENAWVLESQRLETHILLDEFKGIEKSEGQEDNNFYKPYLNNVIALEQGKYLIQLSYIGIQEDKSFLRASFELIAHESDDIFMFSSPLIRNTKTWKTIKINSNIFHYEQSINQTNVETFGKLSAQFDEKLRVEDRITEFYCTENLTDLLRLMGVNYRMDYNGIREANFSSSLDNRKLIILGNDNAAFQNLDEHDLWHDRLSLKISRRKVNKPVDEACAYLYGGSWGLSWEEIFDQFYEKVASNKKTDWVKLKEEPMNFAATRAEHLMADYVVNALIVQQIENEKGFDGVWEFLNCGPFEKGNANYYAALGKLTGINQKDYNKAVWKLIEKQKLLSLANN